MTMLDISLNGERVATEAPTLHALLQARGYDFTTAFACAINNAFVPRPQWPERALQNGDRIDIVTPITGG
ncbi:sulfur carrier protein ThiS [Polaromonas sp.]|uniref:sulfur carrier protein ThiS n=1 Tax=Polaromonas sp. TaxID=1869339 RepID=UPI0025E94D1B|nr:sulfur carrier protein ThiS [Polaromonas sp.]